MKRKAVGFCIAILGLLFIAQPAFAHTLKADGSIGGVIHIDPDDDPIAGQEAQFFFEIKDRQDRYKPGLCDCTAKILQSGQELFSESLFKDTAESSLENASFSYTFPNKGIYTIQVVGMPKQANAFQSFTLSYDIRVERETGTTAITSQEEGWLQRHVFHILGIGIIIAVFASLLFVDRRRGKKNAGTSLQRLSCVIGVILTISFFLHGVPLHAIFDHHIEDDHQTLSCCLPQIATSDYTEALESVITKHEIAQSIDNEKQNTTITFLQNKSPPNISL